MEHRDRKDDAELDLENPIGIAREPIARDLSDVHPDPGDDASVRRRRARAGLGPDGDERRSSGMDDLLSGDHDGATSIDMGSGGDGTDIKP